MKSTVSNQMSSRRQGGRWALAGYLYQIVGTLGITAGVLGMNRQPDDDDGLLVVLRDAGGLLKQAQHEAGGEDALLQFGTLGLDESDDCVLLQFKCSTTGEKIGASHLREIINKLDESAQELSSKGRNVTACVLVTNREFTSRGRDTAEEVWKAEETRPRSYKLRRASYSVEDSVSELEVFARRYGAFEGEIEKGTKTLVGEVIFDTLGMPQDASIDRELLIEAFTGYRDARPLTIEDVKESCQKQLDQIDRYIRVDQWDDSPVPRDVFEEVVRETNERALVGLCGPGGCGKSFIMRQLLNQILDQATGCCMVQFARNVQEDWIENTVHKWRCLPVEKRPSDNLERGIARLLLANPESGRPILWLALDGLDEGIERSKQTDSVRNILGEFWNRDQERGRSEDPPATLVVTCRDVQILKRLLDIPYDYPENHLKTINISYFSPSEFGVAMDQVFGSDNSVLGGRYGDHPEVLHSHGFPSTGLAPGVFDSVGNEVRQCLHHPAMWRALLNLEDEDTQRLAISGDTQTARKLAAQFIEWFHHKLDLRHPQLRMSNLKKLLTALSAIAQHTSGKPAPFFEIDDWTNPVKHLITVQAAGELFDEAKSAGLIDPDADDAWRWRHSIVHDYLKSWTSETKVD